MSTSVGAISFDLEIVNTLNKQLKAIAKSAEGQAAAAFKGVGESVSDSLGVALDKSGKAVSDAITAPVKDAVEEIKTMCNGAVIIGKGAAKAIKTETGALFPDQPGGQKSALAVDMVDDPYGQKAAVSAAPKADAKGLRASADAVGLLNQELDNALNRLRLQENEVDRLTNAYNQIPSSKLGGEEAVKLESQLAAAESRMLSLQKTANGLQTKLDKAMQSKGVTVDTEKAKASVTSLKDAVAKTADSADQKIKATVSKTTGTIGKAMTSIKGKVSGAFKSAGASVNKQVKAIGSKVGGLSKSVKSAFKSAFLMAGLYAAFRGIKSLIGDAVGQNAEFAKSLEVIKGNLLVAFTPIMQTVQPALNALASGFAAVSKQIAAASAGLFGQTYEQAKAATKQMQNVSAAAKKANATLGIDELNTVGQDDSGTDLSALDTAKYEDAASFGERVKSMLSSAAAAVGPLIASVAGKIADAAPQFVSAGVEVVNKLLSGFTKNAPKITTAAITTINAFMKGLNNLIPELGPFAISTITFLASSFLTYAPQMLSLGVTLLANVLQGLSQEIPNLIPLAQNAITTIVQSIRDNLPSIINSGISILTSLISGISEMLPTLIPMAFECILTLVEGLIDNLPTLVDSAIEMITALAEGILAALPLLIEKAPVIIQKLVDGLVDAIPKLIDAAIEIIMGICDFLLDNMDDILKAAIDIVMALASGLVKAIPELIKAIPKLVKAIIDKIKNTDWLQVGKDILSGIGKGLIDGVKNIGGAIKEAAGGLVDGFKSFFGIASPSKLFRDVIGANLAAGIGEGFVEEMDSISGDMNKAVPTSLPAPELEMMGVSGGRNAATASSALQSILGLLLAMSQGVSQITNGNLRMENVEYLLEQLIDTVDAKETVVNVGLDDRAVALAAERGSRSRGYRVVNA